MDNQNQQAERREYYILSLKWTQRGDQWVTFWRRNNSGYAWPLEWSGRYTEDQVTEDLRYYDNKRKDGTIAVPVEAVEAQAVGAYIDRQECRAVPNERDRMKALRAAAVKARRDRRKLAVPS